MRRTIIGFLLLCVLSGALFVPVQRNRFTVRYAGSATTSSTSSTSSTTKTTTSSTASKNFKSSGAALLISNLNVIVPGMTQPLLTDINFRVDPLEKWAIVGANGAGKSTLLKTITGNLATAVVTDFSKPGAGSASGIALGVNQRYGYLEQTAVSGKTTTVFEECQTGMETLEKTKLDIATFTTAIENGDYSDKTLQGLADAEEIFTALGGYNQEAEIDFVLKGLGFSPSDTDKLCSEFSGGYQMKIALARLLLSKPSILLLDEPTNHLDARAKSWLAKYLKNYDGTIIIVTHDTDLIAVACNSIANINLGKLQTYKSMTYDQFLGERKRRAEAALAAYNNNLAEAKRLQDFVDKWGASATKKTMAQDRVKKLEKMQKLGMLTPPDISVVSGEKKPIVNFSPAVKIIGEPSIVRLCNADISYDKDVAPILENVNFDVLPGMRLVIRGVNGAGKTTLFNALRNGEGMVAGIRIENSQLAVNTFSQDLAQILDPTITPIETIVRSVRSGKGGDISISNQRIQSVLGILGLSNEAQNKLISQLSGGQKARVALASFMIRPANLLLLDEPSNHLDRECIAALVEGLSNFEKVSKQKHAAVVFISHDQHFCKAVDITHVATVSSGGVKIVERGLLESDFEINEEVKRNGRVADGIVVEKVVVGEVDAATRKKLMNAPKRLVRLEKDIILIEEKIGQLDVEMLEKGDDYDALQNLQGKKEFEQSKLDKLYAEMEELDTIC